MRDFCKSFCITINHHDHLTDLLIFSDTQGKESQTFLRLNVERPVLEEQELRQLYQYEKPKKSGKSSSTQLTIVLNN